MSLEENAEAVAAAALAAQINIFTLSELERELRQGEVITGITQYLWNSESELVQPVVHPYAFVLNQDCDLYWDYEQRNGRKGSALQSVLFYVAMLAIEKRQQMPPGNDLWRRVINNTDERYHLFSRVDAACDLENQGWPSLVIDFKSFFTLPPDEVYRQIGARSARRRSRLNGQYREHLQSRAAFYLQRVMLPAQHEYTA